MNNYITEQDNYILDMYLNEELSNEDILDLYEYGYISEDVLEYIEEGFLSDNLKQKIKQKARNAALTAGFWGIYKPMMHGIELRNNIKAHGLMKGIHKKLQGQAIERMSLKKYKKYPGNEDKNHIIDMYVGKGHENKKNGAVKKYLDYQKNFEGKPSMPLHRNLQTTYFKGKLYDNKKDKHIVDKIKAKDHKLFNNMRSVVHITDRLHRIKGVKNWLNQ